MKNYILLATIVLAGIVPFSSRAVYMDEHIFLQIGRAAHTNWMFPQDTPGMFFGTAIPNFAAHTHPPVGEYYLALLYSIFGEFREVWFRLSFAVFAIAAVLAFYSLARRFTPHPFLLALLFALTPAFFVYSPTLMMDIPMLAFLLVGFALYFGDVQGRRGLLPAASACFILAVGTGYTAAVPLACFFIGLIAARRPRKELLAVALAPVALALWLVGMTIHFGEFPLIRTVGYLIPHGSVYRNILATLSFLGSLTIFPGFADAKRRTVLVSVGLAAALTLFISWPSLAYRVWFVVLASAGLIVLAAFTAGCRRLVTAGKNHGEAFLMLWVPAVLFFFILIGDMINARYILLAVPALYLVMFADTGQRRLIATLIPTAALSLVLAYSDFTFVNSNRDWVRQTVAPLQQQGFQVWSGAESGLRFYLEQNGISTLSARDSRPRPGDLIVRHELYRYDSELLIVLKEFETSTGWPIRTYNAAAGAGFHDSGWGLVPFTYSRVPFDRIEVAQVSPLPGAVWSPKGPIFQQSEPERDFPMTFPANSKIEYDLEGDGTVATMADRIRLINRSQSPIVWRNFRIVPKQFAVQ
jgi:4-amino-4-deoxy-L-arabinose transferase-like glycosyltransferase